MRVGVGVRAGVGVRVRGRVGVRVRVGVGVTVSVSIRVRVRVRVSSDLAAEDELLVEVDLDEARAAEGVDAALVVVPQAHLGREI